MPAGHLVYVTYYYETRNASIQYFSEEQTETTVKKIQFIITFGVLLSSSSCSVSSDVSPDKENNLTALIL